ncbi:ABC transporter permease [Natrialba taiwanensis]|uniref:Uncharacterized protein n=1 Tax=Natrialba taiwanensis DSM 12281 TaxID=1230458 RepID=L9ZPK0_9EURY|nr:ABC transporter permease [Natrialba taiwanensis]ELY88294.1 hypothetical protein C484_15312 [Natrialba taiwanensis DSM 12281]
MITNIVRTTLEVVNYLEEIRYPRTRILTYIFVSIFVGILLSNSPRAVDLPILTVVAILFGFTINAVVMLGNSSEHYISENGMYNDQLKAYYKKSLYISIHTLGIGIFTIIITGLYQLFPGFSIDLVEIQLWGNIVKVELISAFVYSLIVYYLMVFSLVISSAAELVKIRV